jgi:hypothetical protein
LRRWSRAFAFLSFAFTLPALLLSTLLVRLSALRLALRLNLLVTVLAAAAIATGATAGILRPGLIVFIIPLPLVFITLGVALIPQIRIRILRSYR